MKSKDYDLQAMNELIQKRLEECGGDFLKYVEKYNRHTLKITLTNEQTDTEVVASEITFFNQDNAFSHLGCLVKFLDLLTDEENKDWGYTHTSEELALRILMPMKNHLLGKD